MFEWIEDSTCRSKPEIKFQRNMKLVLLLAATSTLGISAISLSLYKIYLVIERKRDYIYMENMQDLPEMPSIAIANETTNEENFNQLWSQSGECCPIGSIPMRRTTKTDVLRARSVRRFGRRLKKPIRRDSSGGGHEVTYSTPLLRIHNAGE